MHIYDISVSISTNTPVWPGDPKVSLERVSKICEGAAFNVSRFTMSAHSGTHVDAPNHIFGDDALTVDKLDLKTLTGRVYVLNLPDVDMITAPVLQDAEIPPRTRRILFKTRNSNSWTETGGAFHEDFVAVSKDGAQYLVDKGVKLVGVDYLSVAPYEDAISTHEILLGAGIVIVEGLNLSEVSQGRYTLHCLPLKLDGSDGAPARAILIGV